MKITTQGYPLKNFVKSGILREHQQLLNQRGIAIVAHFDENTQTDTSGIWFLLPFVAAIALAALVLAVLAWSRRSRDSNGGDVEHESDDHQTPPTPNPDDNGNLENNGEGVSENVESNETTFHGGVHILVHGRRHNGG